MVAQGGSKPVDVVVVHKVVKAERTVDTAVPARLPVERIGNLKVVFVVVGGVKPFAAFVVGDRIERTGVRPAVVIPMDDLAHQPEIGVSALAVVPELVEKVHVHTVSRVKAQTVDPEFVDPHAHRAKQMAHNVRIAQVELDQIVMPLPAFVPEWIPQRAAAAKIEVVEPAAVGGGGPVFLHILKSPEFAPNVVEYTVEHHPDAVFMQLAAETFEILVRAEAAVDVIVIAGIIAVFARFKHRPDIERIDPKFPQMGNPAGEFPDPVNRGVLAVLLRRPAESERIDMIEDRFVYPVHRLHLSFCNFFRHRLSSKDFRRIRTSF